jgi:5-(carboxyamino)imidazole ribonucleotide mutase
VGLNASQNAAILATQILANSNEDIDKKLIQFKSSLAQKIVKANEEMSKIQYKFKTN